MKASPSRETRLKLDLRATSLKDVKHAAYALSGEAYIRLDTQGNRAVVARLRPRGPGGPAGNRLARLFKQRLAWEHLRGRIEAANVGLREHIIRVALNGDAAAAEPEWGELDAKQQKELDRIIQEVETELAKEGSRKDPLGVTRTWEEAHGAGKAGRRP